MGLKVIHQLDNTHKFSYDRGISQKVVIMTQEES